MNNQNNNNQNVGQNVVKAFVVESDITNAQGNIRDIENKALIH